jgi:tetratricopeptide (TPR) repeat protein
MWMLAAALFYLQAAPLAEGIKALDEGRYEAAAQAFLQAVQADPADYEAHFNLALAYSFLEKDAEGIAEYRKALALKPGLYEAQLNAGILLLRQKNPSEAVPLLEAATAQKPSEFRPNYYLGEAERAVGAMAKAQESYRAAIAIDPKSAAAQLGLGRVLARSGDLAAAAPYFRQAAQLDPAYRDSPLELASFLERGGQTQEALEIYRQFPDNPVAQEHLGQLLIQSKQYRDAVPVLERIFSASPSPENRATLAMAYLSISQLDKALPLLEKAASDGSAGFDLLVTYAHVLRDQKKYQQSARQFAAALKLKPDAAHTWDEMGGVLYLAEDYQPALAAFERAGQLGEKSAGNWFLRAIILDKTRQLKPAVEAYQQFLALSTGQNPDQEWQARQRIRILGKELERR